MHKGNLFGYYILDLKDFYNIDKKAAIKESKEYIRRIKIEKGLNKEKTKTCLIVLFIFTLLIGIVASSITEVEFVLYFFGFVFFISGYLVGINEETQVLGSIFILSHGGLGFWLMSNSIVENILDKQLYATSVNLQYYMNACIVLLIIGTLMLMLCNIFKRIREHNIFKLIPLCIYNVVLILIVIFKMVYLGA